MVLSCTLEGQDSGTRGSLDRFEIWKSCGSSALFLFGPAASYFVTSTLWGGITPSTFISLWKQLQLKIIFCRVDSELRLLHWPYQFFVPHRRKKGTEEKRLRIAEHVGGLGFCGIRLLVVSLLRIAVSFTLLFFF